MPTKDLAAKYGKNKNSRVLVNAAIRAELVGGNETLEALELADRLSRASADIPPGLESYAVVNLIPQTLDAVHAIAAAMRADVRQRYGMPPE